MSQRSNWTLKYGDWRDAFLGFPRLSGHTYEGEDLIQREVYEMMCQFTRSGVYRGIFIHPANELYLGGDKKQAARRIAFHKSLGMMPGATDWIFLWDGGAGVIELKTGLGRLNDNQTHMRNWCLEMAVPWALCRSQEETYCKLLEWGALRVTKLT